MPTQTFSSEHLLYEDGEWKFLKTTKTFRYDNTLQRWSEDRSKRAKSLVPISERGLAKRQKMLVLYFKTMVDPITFEKMKGWFVQTLTASIPNTRRLKHFYIKKTKSFFRRSDSLQKRIFVNAKFILCDLKNNSVVPQGYEPDEYFDKIEITKNKPKRIKLEEVRKLAREGKVEAILNTGGANENFEILAPEFTLKKIKR